MYDPDPAKHDTVLPPGSINTGLSNIATRSARLDPRWPTDSSGKPIHHINTAAHPDPTNALWIDRARVFQTAMSDIADEYGTVDSAINDLTAEPMPFNVDPDLKAKNYCERQGRCNLGCLPGARHTLNKQLMKALYGTLAGPTPQFPNLSLQALAEVDWIEALPAGGYAVHYRQRDNADPSQATPKVVRAKQVILAAGTVGTNEILLRSQAMGGLPNLSDKAGFGFSTNGDYIAFLPDLDQQISLTRGPMTTSFAAFNSKPGSDTSKFHTIEDQGIPRAFSALAGFGVPMVKAMGKGWPENQKLFVTYTLVRWALNRAPNYIGAVFRNAQVRQDVFESEDEMTARMMCAVGAGREASVGQFRLGDPAKGDTTLRLRRTDGTEFVDDPVYDTIRTTLARFAGKLAPGSSKEFINPFLTLDATGQVAPIQLTHALGGCRMAMTAAEGTVNEFGQVFDRTKTGQARPFYEGLYVTDAAIIPTALGVNPSLTISVLALRAAGQS